VSLPALPRSCCLGARLKSKGSGETYAEPKLEPKKHRRKSRKRAKQSMADELEELDEFEELSRIQTDNSTVL